MSLRNCAPAARNRATCPPNHPPNHRCARAAEPAVVPTFGS
jgi:hypothetical protein